MRSFVLKILFIKGLKKIELIIILFQKFSLSLFEFFNSFKPYFCHFFYTSVLCVSENLL